MSDKLVNMRDVQFVLYEMLDVEKLLEYERYAEHSRETFDMGIDAAYKLAREVFWPAYQEMDQLGVCYDPETKQTSVPECMHKIWQVSKEGGWHATSADFEVGGQQFPFTISEMMSFLFNAANTPAHMYVGTTTGAAHLFQSFGGEQLKVYVEKLFEGEWAGTMALTEPQAGSSLSDVKTTAVKAQSGDHYLITGTKLFISSGDHDLAGNIVHPILAKLPDAPLGIKGISLFLVPKYRVNEDGSVGEFNDVVTSGVEHKMGLKGQATATLNFGDNGDCHGWLVGEPNRGLKYMFQLMNSARIATGIQASSVASNAYQQALEYARERLQGRPIMQKDPTTPQIPIIQHADVRRMLLAQKAYVEGMFSLLAYAASLTDKKLVLEDADEREKAEDILEILTPVCKGYGSDISFESTRLAIQVFGGYGFSEEFPVAQMLRDQKVFSIYEGTNGIQAMDLLGRKIVIKQGASMKALIAEISKTVADARAVEAINDMTDKVEAAMNDVVGATMHLAAIAGSGDITHYISFATPYLEMFSQLVVSWQFLWQSTVAQKAIDAGADDESFYKSKLATARYYINNVLPYAQATAQIIKSSERTALDFEEEWF